VITMFILFEKSTGAITSVGYGYPDIVPSGNKLLVGNDAICNDSAAIGYKYIADQVLAMDENGVFVNPASAYPEVQKPVDKYEQLAAVVDELLLGGV